MQNCEWPMSNNFLPLVDTHTTLQFTIGTITNYFVTRITSDGKSANDFKSINSKAYPLFKDGHIQDIKTYTTTNKIYYQANCLPEMKKNTIYKIRLTVDKTSEDIEYAECGCAAGKGATGSCKHIAAMCYALEDYTHVQRLRDCVPCTSQLQTWNQPRKRTLEAADVGDIKFIKLEYGKTKRTTNVVPYDPRPTEFRNTSLEEVQSLRQSLESKGSIALLHVLPRPPTPQTNQPAKLPPIPRSAIARVRYRLLQCPQPVSFGELLHYCRELVWTLSPSPEQIAAIESATREQHQCKRWHEERYGRLTSSVFGEIVKCRVYEGHAQRLIYPNKSSLSTSAIQWGKFNESTARQQYEQHLYSQSKFLKVRGSGIVVSSKGFLAASPDAVVCKEDGTVMGAVEIKCPFSHRNSTISEACKQARFFCEKKESSGCIELKETHNYYYQIQGQMAVQNLPWCDFVVWTTKDIHIQRIHFNETFWKDHCYPKLHSFYYGIILPELVYPRHPSGLSIADYRHNI